MDMKTAHIIAGVVMFLLIGGLVALLFIDQPDTATGPKDQQATSTTPVATSTPVKPTTPKPVTPATTTPATTTPAVTGTPIEVHGTQVCLPFKDPSGIHIMLCAIGLKTTSGNKYYSLHDTAPDYSNLSKFSSEGTYEIRGTFTEKEDPTFVSEGVIDVESVKKI